jgi:hypothetical protein
MTGKQANFAVAGAQNEAVAQDLIGRLSAPVRVPREHDFGVDFFCQLYTPDGTKSVAITDVFTLQAKGSSELLRFGGVRNGEWRDYELAWLRTLAVPLFLARVDAAQPTLDLYCLGQIWRVLWQTAAPFEINCVTDPPTTDIHQSTDVRYESSEESYGDRRRWTVPLGPPFLRLTHANLADNTWRSQARNRLELLIRIERANLLRFHQRVALHKSLERWSTNSFSDQVVLSKAMFWSPVPGDNLRELAEALLPVVVNLGAHLQWQNDRDAYRLIEILEWLNARGALDSMGRGLLDGLRATQAKGLGPADELPGRNPE